MKRKVNSGLVWGGAFGVAASIALSFLGLDAGPLGGAFLAGIIAVATGLLFSDYAGKVPLVIAAATGALAASVLGLLGVALSPMAWLFVAAGIGLAVWLVLRPFTLDPTPP